MFFRRYGFQIGPLSVMWWDLWESMRISRTEALLRQLAPVYKPVPYWRTIRQRMAIEIKWRRQS